MAHPHPRAGAMNQYDETYRLGGNPRTPTSPTIEHYLRGGEATRWSPNPSLSFGRDHDTEYDHGMHHKKSVLAKVKEKARKWKSTLTKKKHGGDVNSTPSWGVSLEDDDEEDGPEYLGAPMYESEMAPQDLKETARQHPRAIPVISENHVLSGSANVGSGKNSPSEYKPMSENLIKKQENERSRKSLTETVAEKLAPAYATVSDATHAIASKIQSLTVSNPQPSSAPAVTNPPAVKTKAASPTSALKQTSPSSAPASMALKQTSPTSTGSGIRAAPTHAPPPAVKTTAESSTSALKQTSPSSAPASMALKQNSPTATGSGIRAAPTHASATTTAATNQACTATTAAPIQAPATSAGAATTAVSPGSSEQIWDKGVSVKQYIMHKLEPGDDERALSQVISQAISPKKNPGEVGVMEKVKEVVTSLLHNEESQAAFSSSNQKSTSRIPLSANAHEVVEEENHGRVLQAN